MFFDLSHSLNGFMNHDEFVLNVIFRLSFLKFSDFSSFSFASFMVFLCSLKYMLELILFAKHLFKKKKEMLVR